MKWKKINVDKTMKYLLLLLLFYFGQTGTLNYAKFPAYSFFILTGMFMVGMAAFLYFFIRKSTKVSYKAIMLGGICILNFLLTMVINRDFRGSYALLVMNILLAVAFTGIYERREFYEMYTNCILFISVISMAATYIILPLAQSHIPVIQTGGEIKYYDMLLAYPLIHVESYRLNGIWTEPGMFAAYLMFALVFALFFNKKNKVKCAVLILAMLFTRSSTGYAILMMILGIYILKQLRDNHKLIQVVYILIACCIGFVVIYIALPGPVEQILSKFQTNSINFIGRFAPMLYNMDMWTTSPLFGVGFHEGMFRVNYKIYRGVLFANTSTTTLLFHNFGLFIPVLSVAATWKLSKTCREHWLIVLLLTMTMVLGVNFENQVLDQIYSILLFSIFMPLKEREKQNENIADKFHAGIQRL